MIYRDFLLLVFAPGLVAVVLALAIRVARGRHRDRSRRVAILSVCAVLPVAVVFTAPWDSWLIAESVWWYPPHSVVGTLFGVPVEEYLFMAGSALLTGCWTALVIPTARSAPTVARDPTATGTRRDGLRLSVGAAFLTMALVGAVAAVVAPRATYLGSLLAWFGLPLAVQAFFGADVLWARKRTALLGLALTPVLWIEDAIAIRAGAWQISDVRTVGLSVFGLPLEEMVFFLVVNLLVVNTVLLTTGPRSWVLPARVA